MKGYVVREYIGSNYTDWKYFKEEKDAESYLMCCVSELGTVSEFRQEECEIPEGKEVCNELAFDGWYHEYTAYTDNEHYFCGYATTKEFIPRCNTCKITDNSVTVRLYAPLDDELIKTCFALKEAEHLAETALKHKMSDELLSELIGGIAHSLEEPKPPKEPLQFVEIDTK